MLTKNKPLTPETLPIRVLIVDDDEDDFIITSEYIKNIKDKRFVIDWCHKYKEAVDSLCRGEYDICFIDYYLGAKTGLDLMKEALQNNCDQPLILLTGMGNPQIDMEVMEAGAFDYLVKLELNTEKLERCIRYSLGKADSIKKLRENERKFRSIFEQSRDAVFLTDEKLCFKDVNYITAELFGYSREELLLMSLYDFLVNKDDALSIKEQLFMYGTVEDKEIEFLSAKGEKIFTTLSVSKEKDAKGNVYMQGIIHDITNLKNAERATLQAEKLAAANRLIRALAHEVRNPLNNINLSIEELTQEDMSDNAQFYLDIIRRNSKRINDLIAELLNSSSSKGENVNEKICIQHIMDDSISAIMDRMMLKRVNWKIMYPDDPAYVFGDAKKLQIAFTNIIINAIEAMEEDKGELNISVSSQQEHHLISIRDNGSGISKENLSHLFEPYFTFKRNGLGLGLATTLNIIQSHKGTIDVESEENNGSNFILKFERA